MEDSDNEISRLLEELRERDDTLSAAVQNYPDELEGFLNSIDAILAVIPELLRPIGFVNLRARMVSILPDAKKLAVYASERFDYTTIGKPGRIAQSAEANGTGNDKGKKGPIRRHGLNDAIETYLKSHADDGEIPYSQIFFPSWPL